MLLLGDTEEQWVVVWPAQVSAGAGLHLLGNHMAWGRILGCDTHRAGSSGWKWNGQGEAGPPAISTQKSLAVPIVMDQVIPEGEQ